MKLSAISTNDVKVDYATADGTATAGSDYTSKSGTLTIPANTLLFRSEGLRVAVVRGGRAELTPVQIGRDFGDTVEVVSGVRPSDSIVLDPPDSLISGTAVRPNPPKGGATR